LFGTALAVMIAVPVPADLPVLAWNSAWVFRGEVFLAVHLLAIALAMIYASIITGRGFEQIGIGPFTLAREARAALGEGANALTVAHDELKGQIDAIAASNAETRRAVEALAAPDPDPTLGRLLAHGPAGRAEVARSPAQSPEFAQAMDKVQDHLDRLDELLGTTPPPAKS
jgi:hypothetical protein